MTLRPYEAGGANLGGAPLWGLSWDPETFHFQFSVHDTAPLWGRWGKPWGSASLRPFLRPWNLLFPVLCPWHCAFMRLVGQTLGKRLFEAFPETLKPFISSSLSMTLRLYEAGGANLGEAPLWGLSWDLEPIYFHFSVCNTTPLWGRWGEPLWDLSWGLIPFFSHLFAHGTRPPVGIAVVSLSSHLFFYFPICDTKSSTSLTTSFQRVLPRGLA